MRRATLWSLAITFVLLLYLGATLLISLLFEEISERQVFSTRTPDPTFTITPTAEPVVLLPPVTSTPPAATPSPSSTPAPTALPTATSTATPVPIRPQVVAAIAVNVRAGPGTNYPVIDALLPNVALPVVGRNEARSWWQVRGPEGNVGWVADSVVTAQDVEEIAVVQAPPPPVPTSTPVPPVPTKPPYQYEPTGWYADTNYGLTRFLGSITDVNGNPVDGIRVEAQCGSFRIISNPSGPVGAGYFNESADWPPGFYDITLDTRPIPCKWFLTVVTTEDGQTATSRLSESIEVETTIEESIVTANWRKNW